MNEALMALLRRHDPDRFLTVLFAPPDKRDALLALYALNHELARAREAVSEPPLALIRLQWWREVIEGEAKRHEVATPLSEAIASGTLEPARLLPLVDAREVEAYGDFTATADWRAWLLAGAGGLAVAAAAALGAADPEVFRLYGAAYGAAGLARSTGVLAAAGRCLLPEELLARHGLTREGFVDDPGSVAGRAVLAEVVLTGLEFLREARPIRGAAVAAALSGVLARRDLRRWPVAPVPRGLGDRLAVMWAGVTGRVQGAGVTRPRARPV
jgi:phytoene synthase